MGQRRACGSQNADGSLVQIGVTSYGDTRCGTPNTSDISFRISHYIDWIQKRTGNAATPVKQASINNVAISSPSNSTTEDSIGNFRGSSVTSIRVVDRRQPLPTSAIVAGIVCACALFLGTKIILTVLSKRRRMQSKNHYTNTGMMFL